MSQTFTATILQEEGKNATGISVPAHVIDALGSGKRPKVKVSLNNFTYHSTVAAYLGFGRHGQRRHPQDGAG